MHNNEDLDPISGLVYAFDVGKVYPHFHLLPERTQSSIEQNIVRVIYDSFVIPADEDYLMARLLAQKGLHRGFFWAASQAIEKYLKAFLMMHDQGVKHLSNGHPVEQLFSAASTFNVDIGDISLEFHPGMQIDAEIASHLSVFTPKTFLHELTVHGASANRYNASGVTFNTGHLFALDAFAYELRRKIGVLEIKDSFRLVNENLRRTFYINNYYFPHTSVAHAGLPNPEFPIEHSLNATWLDYLNKNKSHQTCSVALQWLKQKMRL